MFPRFGVVVAVAFAVGVVLVTAKTDSVGPDEARVSEIHQVAPVSELDVSTGSVGAVEPLCQLLELAAAADPSLQRAASRPASDINEVVAIQKQLLEVAAERLGDDPDASAFRSLAMAFAPIPTGNGEGRMAGSWTDDEWARALMERASSQNLEVLAAWDTRCS